MHAPKSRRKPTVLEVKVLMCLFFVAWSLIPIVPLLGLADFWLRAKTYNELKVVVVGRKPDQTALDAIPKPARSLRDLKRETTIVDEKGTYGGFLCLNSTGTIEVKCFDNYDLVGGMYYLDNERILVDNKVLIDRKLVPGIGNILIIDKKIRIPPGSAKVNVGHRDFKVDVLDLKDLRKYEGQFVTLAVSHNGTGAFKGVGDTFNLKSLSFVGKSRIFVVPPKLEAAMKWYEATRYVSSYDKGVRGWTTAFGVSLLISAVLCIITYFGCSESLYRRQKASQKVTVLPNQWPTR